jgi:hypothetical protein
MERALNRAFAALLPLAALTAGCVTISWDESGNGPPPPAAPCQVVTFWENHVTFAPDPARGGVNAPVLLGKLYLFGPEIGFPLNGDGSLVVQLEDESAGKPVPLEVWNFDPETLKRCQRKDAVGWGYSVCLPWGTYRPDVSKVHLRVCYLPAKGTPLYTDNHLTLDRDNGVLSTGPTLTEPNNPPR